VRLSDNQLSAGARATAVAGLVVVVCLALAARAALPMLSAWYPIKAAAMMSAVMLLALGRLHEHHPFGRFGPANQVTTARAILVVLVAGLIGEPPVAGLATAAVASSIGATVLDGVDGWLARQARMTSAFGARFDVEVDALLIQVLAILAWRYGKAGPWVLLSGLIRYGFVGAGQVWAWIRGPLSPTLRGRVICVVQIVALVLVIVPAIAPPVSTVIAALGLAAVSYSFLIDMLRLWHARPAVAGGSRRFRIPDGSTATATRGDVARSSHS
jgi:phosphatidylglycerophosphate synthase